MKRYGRKFTPEAAELIRKLPPGVKSAIRALTDKLLVDPEIGKPLQRELAGFYSVRHQRYRVIYQVDAAKKAIIIAYVGLRRDIYDLFKALVAAKKKML